MGSSAQRNPSSAGVLAHPHPTATQSRLCASHAHANAEMGRCRVATTQNLAKRRVTGGAVVLGSLLLGRGRSGRRATHRRRARGGRAGRKGAGAAAADTGRGAGKRLGGVRGRRAQAELGPGRAASGCAQGEAGVSMSRKGHRRGGACTRPGRRTAQPGGLCDAGAAGSLGVPGIGGADKGGHVFKVVKEGDVVDHHPGHPLCGAGEAEGRWHLAQQPTARRGAARRAPPGAHALGARDACAAGADGGGAERGEAAGTHLVGGHQRLGALQGAALQRLPHLAWRV